MEPRTCFPLYRFHRFAAKKDAASKRGTSFDDSNKNDKIEESIRASYEFVLKENFYIIKMEIFVYLGIMAKN